MYKAVHFNINEPLFLNAALLVDPKRFLTVTVKQHTAVIAGNIRRGIIPAGRVFIRNHGFIHIFHGI